MNLDLLEEFIRQIELLNNQINNPQLTFAISSAKSLVMYGEYGIALEDLLDNLFEESIVLNKDIVDLAHQAFGSAITSEQESILKMFRQQSNHKKV